MNIGDLICLYGEYVSLVIDIDDKCTTLYLFDTQRKIRYYHNELDICGWSMLSESRCFSKTYLVAL